MNWDALGALAETLGTIAVVISLVYIAVEVRQNTRQHRLNEQRDLLQEFGQLSLAVANNENLARILNIGASDIESLQSSEVLQFQSYLSHLFKLIEQQYHIHLEGSGDSEVWETMQSMMDDFLMTPGCKAWWIERSNYHTKKFQALVEGRIQNQQ